MHMSVDGPPGWCECAAGVKLTSTQEQERALGRIREQVMYTSDSPMLSTFTTCGRPPPSRLYCWYRVFDSHVKLAQCLLHSCTQDCTDCL